MDAMGLIAATLRRYPEIAVFLTLGLGYLLGRIRVRRFALGTVVGTLIVGMVVGQAGVEAPVLARTLFFLLFMFATGYHVGPQFFSSLRQGGGRLVVLSLTFAAVGLGATLLAAWYLRLDAGFAGGLLSGSLTQSSVIGTASDAIQRLPLGDAERSRLLGHVPVADAVTYLYGTIGVTLLLTRAFPVLMGVDLAAECRKYEEQLGASRTGAAEQAGFEASISVDIQGFRLTEPGIVGRPVGDLQRAGGERVHVARLRRGADILKPDDAMPLRQGDIVVLTGPREELLRTGRLIGEAVVDPAAMGVPLRARTVIITNHRAVETPMGELRGLDEKRGAGVHVRRVTRQGQPVPILPRATLQRGDAVELVGAVEDLDRVTPLLGVAEVPTDKTNFVAMGLTIAAGAVAGVLTIRLGGVPLGLGVGGGVLLAGLALGWFQSYNPSFGRIPGPAVWLMENLGLNAFIAMVGLAAGPHAVEALRSSGLQLLVASIVVATLPHAATFALGRYVLGLNAGYLMGILAGAGTVTAGLQALVDETDSSVPVLGYTVPYAINNILLTAWGPVVVAASQLWVGG